MNHQAKLIGIRRLAHRIEAERIRIMGGVPGKGTHDHAQLEQKLVDWEQSFVALTRDLKSQSHFNHMIYNQQRFSPNAYSAKQSFQNRQQNVKELSEALADVEARLRALMAAFFDGKSGGAAALEGIANAMSNWQKACKHSKEGFIGQAPGQVQSAIVEVRSHLPAPANAMPGMGAVDIFTIILAYFAFLKSMSKSK